MVLGAITHTAFSMRAKAKQQLTSRRTKMKREHVPQHDLTMDEGNNSSHLSGALTALSTLKRKLIDEPVANDGLGEYLDNNREGQTLEPAVSAPIEPASQPLQPQGIAAPHPKQEIGTAPTKHVVPQAEKPKAGKRALTEAQKKLPGLNDPSEFELPPLRLLTEAPDDMGVHGLSEEAMAQNAQLLESVLADFGVKGEIVQVRPGPVVTLYELEPAPGIKSSRVIGLADDIARSMSAIAARVAVIPGKNAIGIELPLSLIHI